MMEFELLENNKCVQIESMQENPYQRTIRGIVLNSCRDYVVLITEVGTKFEIEKAHILSVVETEFAPAVYEKMSVLKKHHEDKRELELQLEKLNKNEQKVLEDLLDAGFLSKFNIIGATNRLGESIPKDLLEFTRNMHQYQISFKPNYNNETDMIIKVTNEVEYQSPGKPETEKLIKAYGPQEITLLKKTLKASKIELIEQDAFNSNGAIYKVFSVYSLSLTITPENFVQTREQLIRRLSELKK